jgi:phosphate transport system protein
LLDHRYRDRDEARHLLLVIQVVPEIERAGDLVQHIAARASQGVGGSLTAPARLLVERMGDIGVAMWRAAAMAYADSDRAAAATLRSIDDELDDLHVSLTQTMAQGSMSIATAIELGLVARFLERVGDHAVNITRRLDCSIATIV